MPAINLASILAPLQRRSWRVVPHIHPILQRRFPEALWAGSGQRPEIALTFDDGPDPYDTALYRAVPERYKRVGLLW